MNNTIIIYFVKCLFKSLPAYLGAGPACYFIDHFDHKGFEIYE